MKTDTRLAMGLAGALGGYLLGALGGYFVLSGGRGDLGTALVAFLICGPTVAVIAGVIGLSYKWPEKPPSDSQ